MINFNNDITVVIALALLLLYISFNFIFTLIEKRRERKEKEILIEEKVNIAVKKREKEIRKDAINKSIEVRTGQIYEVMLPLIASNGHNSAFDKLKDSSGEIHYEDFRFLGSPIDYIYMKGLTKGNLEEIVFIEIKKKKANLPKREKQIRDLITSLDSPSIKWELIIIEQNTDKDESNQ